MSLSLGRKLNWLWLFPAIGVLMLAIAVVIWTTRMRFEATAIHADGEVTALVHSSSTDSDGNSSSIYCPEVRFLSRDGRTVEFSGSTCTQPASYDVGDSVEVLYPADAPRRARLNGFAERWLGALIVGGIGLVFALVGLAITVPILLRGRRARDLQQSGRPVSAMVTEVARNGGLEVNGQSPWRIHAQWQDPATRKLHIFESDNLWFDPSPYLHKEIRVMLDPSNPKRYWVDTIALPELA